MPKLKSNILKQIEDNQEQLKLLLSLKEKYPDSHLLDNEFCVHKKLKFSECDGIIIKKEYSRIVCKPYLLYNNIKIIKKAHGQNLCYYSHFGMTFYLDMFHLLDQVNENLRKEVLLYLAKIYNEVSPSTVSYPTKESIAQSENYKSNKTKSKRKKIVYCENTEMYMQEIRKFALIK